MVINMHEFPMSCQGGRNCQRHQYSGECPVSVVSLALDIKPVKLRNDISISFNAVDSFKSHILREATVLTADICQLNLGKIKYSLSLCVSKGNPTWIVYVPPSSLRRAWHHTVKSHPWTVLRPSIASTLHGRRAKPRKQLRSERFHNYDFNLISCCVCFTNIIWLTKLQISLV